MVAEVVEHGQYLWAQKQPICLTLSEGSFVKSCLNLTCIHSGAGESGQVKKGLHKGRKKKKTLQLDKLTAQKGTHMLSGSCTFAWASSSEVKDATLGGRGTPAEDGEGPGGDAS